MGTYYLNYILMFLLNNKNLINSIFFFKLKRKEGCGLLLRKTKRQVVFDIISFYCNACMRCMNHIVWLLIF